MPGLRHRTASPTRRDDLRAQRPTPTRSAAFALRQPGTAPGRRYALVSRAVHGLAESLRPHLNQIRAWVQAGPHRRLGGASARGERARHRAVQAPERAGERRGGRGRRPAWPPTTPEEIDLRAEDDLALIAARARGGRSRRPSGRRRETPPRRPSEGGEEAGERGRSRRAPARAPRRSRAPTAR